MAKKRTTERKIYTWVARNRPAEITFYIWVARNKEAERTFCIWVAMNRTSERTLYIWVARNTKAERTFYICGYTGIEQLTERSIYEDSQEQNSLNKVLYIGVARNRNERSVYG